MFAMEHYGVTPDMTTLAKGLAGGMPISAVCGRADIMDAAAPGGLGGTYAGNPVSVAAALAVLGTSSKKKACCNAQRCLAPGCAPASIGWPRMYRRSRRSGAWAGWWESSSARS
jgi:acetylornithine/succinyldiaminopimelate/putrescine aminotransferase